ncbi:MAG: type II toxin-antitoxin system HicB family antitoxin [Erysipelotrichaceae bacterium]|nr:type II toxin-antitoxin system HicB family antitoxin [Erysipelotrichaceae bacterium]
MSKVYYPAVFHEDKDVGGYWVEFPDLEGCFTQGDDEKEAMEMAKEVLSLWLDTSLNHPEFNDPAPSTCHDIMAVFPGEIVMLIEGDPELYKRKYHNKAVKKTLTIPEWLNDYAVKANVNFSQVLQEALIEKLNL